MNKTLKRRENPNSAPIQIQNQYSSVKKPLDLRSALPTVGSLILGYIFGCIICNLQEMTIYRKIITIIGKHIYQI